MFARLSSSVVDHRAAVVGQDMEEKVIISKRSWKFNKSRKSVTICDSRDMKRSKM